MVRAKLAIPAERRYSQIAHKQSTALRPAVVVAGQAANPAMLEGMGRLKSTELWGKGPLCASV
jgi:hypothetical protein